MSDWLSEVKGRVPHRPKRRWWAVAARPMPQMPLDLVTTPGVAAVGAYGLRQMRARYVGPAINVQRSSDSATMDIGFRGPGDLDVSTLANFIGVSTGTMVIWYDQSGQGNNLTVGASAPTMNLTGLNGKPTAVFVDATVMFNGNAVTPVIVQPFTCSAVAERTGNTAAYNDIMADNSGSASGFYFNNAPNGSVIYAGGAGVSAPVATCSDNVAHSMLAIFNGATSIITIDGTSTNTGGTTNPGTGSFTGLRLGHQNGGLTGFLSEAVFWSGQVDAGSIAAVSANQKAYWLTP